MPQAIPDLNLSHGQLLWSVRYGCEPDRRFKNEIRYLRLIDIPPASGAQAEGPGKRITYDFYDLVELGLAVTGLNLRFKPKDIAKVLVGKREAMRRIYAENWMEMDEDLIHDKWVKSRGRRKMMPEGEQYIRLHDRHSEKWGQIDLVSFEEATQELGAFEPIERMADGTFRPLLPLKTLMLQFVAWALEAPETRPGRK